MSRPPRFHQNHEGEYRLCQEPACRENRLRYGKRWKLDQARGISRTVDPEPAQMHVASLIGAGWSARAIAAAADVSPSTITRLRRKDNKQLSRHHAQAVLAVSGIPAKASAQTLEPFVPRIGTVRRVQALIYLGWTHDRMSECGIKTSLMISQQGRWVTRSTHDKVAAIYRELSGRPGPSIRNQLRARRLGYHGPLAWDDIDLDAEPDVDSARDGSRLREEVDHVVVERVLAGDLVDANPAERRLIVARWVTNGRSLADLERRTGWKPERYATNGEDAA